MSSEMPLADWLKALSRWCMTLPAVSAIYAAEFALPVWEAEDAGQTEGGYHLEVQRRDMARGGQPRNAVDAAVAWRDGGRTREQEAAWAIAWDAAEHDRPGGGDDWRPAPNMSPIDYAGDTTAAERLAPGAEVAAREGLLRWLIASIEVGS